jgi:hypothetical protein
MELPSRQPSGTIRRTLCPSGMVICLVIHLRGAESTAQCEVGGHSAGNVEARQYHDVA